MVIAGQVQPITATEHVISCQAERVSIRRVTNGNDSVKHGTEMELWDTEIISGRLQPIREPR